jgi:predicted methyltransferase
MHRRRAILFTVIGSLAFATWAHAADPVPAYIAAAVNDAGRPDADKKLDAGRKPAEMLTFAGIRPGYKVADFLPGGGYFTRIFSAAVGVSGHVYALDPDDWAKMRGDAMLQIVKSPAYANVSLLDDNLGKIKTPQPVDVVWTAQNYHDLHDRLTSTSGMVAFNKTIFAMLKPGGVYIVIDHAAGANPPADVTSKLHRIDPATVKAEVLAAGFTLEGESDALRNPADDHTLIVFDPKIRGKTDQFVLKFRKPK